MTAAADTSSLSYLAVLGLLDLFPRIFDRVVVPEAVILELQSPKAPLAVAELLKTPPAWFERGVVPPDFEIEGQPGLHDGEREVIAVALAIPDSIAILDDRAARRYARLRGLKIVGTVGILMRAADEGWINLEQSLDGLEQAGFRLGRAVRKEALDRQE